jgi:hypothetical protein
MRIIGSTKTGFIVEMDKDELTNLCGYHSEYCMRDARKKDIEVGEKFDIKSLYKKATETLTAYREIKEKFKAFQQQTGRLLALMGPDEKDGE